jgi:hypothetical protein
VIDGVPGSEESESRPATRDTPLPLPRPLAREAVVRVRTCWCDCDGCGSLRAVLRLCTAEDAKGVIAEEAEEEEAEAGTEAIGSGATQSKSSFTLDARESHIDATGDVAVLGDVRRWCARAFGVRAAVRPRAAEAEVDEAEECRPLPLVLTLEEYTALLCR